MNRRFKEIVFGLLFFALQLPSPGYPLSYYADSGCTYDGDGTESFCAPGAGQPGAFNNLSSVQTFLTGDQSGNVLALMGGSVFRELFAAAISGSSGSPFRITRYGDASLPDPRIDASTVLANASFALVSGKAKTYQQTVANGRTYTESKNGVSAYLINRASIDLVEANPGSWYWSSGVLYIHPSDSTNPTINGYIYEYSARECALRLNGVNYIDVDQVHFRGGNAIPADYVGTTVAGNVEIRGSTHINLDDIENSFGNFYGVAVGDSSDYISVSNSHFHSTKQAAIRFYINSDHVTASNNTITRAGYDMLATGEVQGIMCDRCKNPVFNNNSITYCGNANESVSGAIAVIGLPDTNAVVRYNYMAHNPAGGLNYRGTIAGQEAEGDGNTGGLVYGNVSLWNGSYGDYDYWFRNLDGTGIYNNTGAYSGRYGVKTIPASTETVTIQNVKFKNNLIAFPGQNAARGCLITTSTHLSGMDTDYNLYYEANSGATIAVGGTNYWSTGTYKTAVAPKETSSIGADPKFISTDNVGLLPVSPAINAGALIAGIHDQATAAADIAGTSITTLPDIGACEYTIQDLYFNANAPAGGTGAPTNPYHLFADYPSWAGYAVRAGTSIYATGTFAAGLDLSSLTEAPTYVGPAKNEEASFSLTTGALSVPIFGHKGRQQGTPGGRGIFRQLF